MGKRTSWWFRFSIPNSNFIFRSKICSFISLRLNRFRWDFSLSLHVFFPHDVSGLIFVWKARSGWKIQFTVIVTFVSRERVRKGFCVQKEKMFTLRFFKSPSEMLHQEIVAWSFRIYKKSPLICSTRSATPASRLKSRKLLFSIISLIR